MVTDIMLCHNVYNVASAIIDSFYHGLCKCTLLVQWEDEYIQYHDNTMVLFPRKISTVCTVHWFNLRWPTFAVLSLNTCVNLCHWNVPIKGACTPLEEQHKKKGMSATWTHYLTTRLPGWPFPGDGSNTLVKLREVTPELLENHWVCLLDAKGIAQI